MAQKQFLDQYIADWNADISEWNKPGHQHRFGLPPIAEFYRGHGDAALQTDILPEPYVGNPLGKTVEAVILSLNPGPDCSTQREGGELYAAVVASSYSALFTTWGNPIPDETRAFWNRRAKWIAKLYGKDFGANPCERIFGLDLLPFHSSEIRGFAAPNKSLPKSVLDYIEKRVLLPAAVATNRKECVRPIIFAVGRPINTVCDQLGFGDVAHTFPSIGKGKRQAHERTKNIDGIPCCIFVTWAQGGNGAPSAEYNADIWAILNAMIVKKACIEH